MAFGVRRRRAAGLVGSRSRVTGVAGMGTIDLWPLSSDGDEQVIR